MRNPGPDEQGAYSLQNLLSSKELQRWTSLAQASDVSDPALNELELPSTSAALSRHSCSAETREAFFTRRSAHLLKGGPPLAAATWALHLSAPPS